MTIGAYVAANPGAAGLLEELGVDFCCGGHRDLGTVLREKGLDPATFEVLTRASERVLAREPAGLDASNPALLPTPELIDHIVSRHHRFLWDQLPVLGDRAAKVASAHGGRDVGLVELEAQVGLLANDLVAHLTEEEKVLFPLILSGQPVPAGLWASLTGDHDEAGALLVRIRELAHDYAIPGWACPTYRALMEGLAALEADLHVHIHLENNVLFLRKSA
jgi:regulator of cell morphogenesis and NO signaling